MENQFYDKFVNFLIKHNLYDVYNFKYIWNQAAFIDARDDDYSFLLGGCANIINKKGKLQDVIPCLPNLNDDKSVAIAIYGYVQALINLSNLNKKYVSNIYYSYILPLFYEKLFILENNSKELLEYEKNMRKNLLNYRFFDYKLILDTVDDLVTKYNNGTFDEKKVARKTKRLSKIYLNMGNKN